MESRAPIGSGVEEPGMATMPRDTGLPDTSRKRCGEYEAAEKSEKRACGVDCGDRGDRRDAGTACGVVRSIAIGDDEHGQVEIISSRQILSVGTEEEQYSEGVGCAQARSQDELLRELRMWVEGVLGPNDGVDVGHVVGLLVQNEVSLANLASFTTDELVALGLDEMVVFSILSSAMSPLELT